MINPNLPKNVLKFEIVASLKLKAPVWEAGGRVYELGRRLYVPATYKHRPHG